MEVKHVDKSSPYLIQSLIMKGDNPAGVGVEYKQVTLKKNPNFDIESMEMTSEMNFNLSEKTEIVIDGKMSDSSLDELLASKISWNLDSAVLSISEKTGKVEKMNFSTNNPEEGDNAIAGIDIRVEVTWPPMKAKIWISF